MFWDAIATAGALEGAAFGLWQAERRADMMTQDARLQAEQAELARRDAELTRSLGDFAMRDAAFEEYDADLLAGQASLAGEIADLAQLEGDLAAELTMTQGKAKIEDAFRAMDHSMASTVVQAAAAGVEMVPGTTSAAIVERTAAEADRETTMIRYETEIAAIRQRRGGQQAALGALEKKLGLESAARRKRHQADKTRVGAQGYELDAAAKELAAAQSRNNARKTRQGAAETLIGGGIDYRNTMIGIMQGMMSSMAGMPE